MKKTKEYTFRGRTSLCIGLDVDWTYPAICTETTLRYSTHAPKLKLSISENSKIYSVTFYKTDSPFNDIFHDVYVSKAHHLGVWISQLLNSNEELLTIDCMIKDNLYMWILQNVKITDLFKNGTELDNYIKKVYSEGVSNGTREIQKQLRETLGFGR